MDEQAVEKMVHVALALMAKRASNLEPGEQFTESDIATAIVADQVGNTAHYFADLLATGIEHYLLFRECGVPV